MSKQHSTDTQDLQQTGADASESPEGGAVEDDQTPGVLELARLLEARIEGLCRELDEKTEQIEALTRSLAERNSRLEEVHRELDESRGLIAQLQEASRQSRSATTEAETEHAVEAARESEADARPDADETHDAERESQPEAPVEAADLVAAAIKRQDAERSEDQSELDDLLSQLSHWAGRGERLRDGLAPAVETAAAELNECSGAFESMPAKMQEALKGRHEGLELIGKMIGRLPGRLPGADEPSEPSLPCLSEDEWAGLFAGVDSRESAEKRIREKLEALSSRRYKALSEQRRLVETSRQSLMQFLKAQVLPILDGIEDGEAHSSELIAELKTGDRQSVKSLDAWYGAYATLHAELLGLLSLIEVRPLEVECGAPIDYDRQEPFGVEEDPDLNTEDVKAVTRTGYEIAMEGSDETVVLRPAQVIVVKNAKESNRA